MHNCTMPPALSPASSLPTWAKSENVETDSQLWLLKGQLRQYWHNNEKYWHNKRVDRGGIWNHIWSCRWILFNPSQGVISVCWLQAGGRNVSGLWPKIRSLFLRNLLSWWLNDRACIVLVHPGSAGRWLEDFLPCDLCAALREAAPKDKIQQEILRPSCVALSCLSIKFHDTRWQQHSLSLSKPNLSLEYS